MLPGPSPRGNRVFLEIFMPVPLDGSGLEASEGSIQSIEMFGIPENHHVSFLKSCGLRRPFFIYLSGAP